MTVILGLDVGERKIGVAIGDTMTKMAFTRPALLVESWAQAWPLITNLIHDNAVTQVLVGLPLNDDGSEGSQAERIREFIDEFRRQSSVEIVTRDERLSSVAVQREQRQAGRVLARGEEDSLAAQLLLESYLQEQV
jgi:putative Holliday junction resolvase